MISVIIPTLNEETSLPRTVQALLAARGRPELIVVDGQSQDATVALASRYCRTISSSPGRALQMNRGAEEARGDIFLFLHADALVPPSGLLAIQRAMEDRRIVGGNFDVIFEGRGMAPGVFTLINRWRRHFGIFYGDSGIFVRRDAFRALSGFRPLPLMEDYDFARRLVKIGKTVCLKDSLLVSARRWEEHGLFRTMAAWFLIQTFFMLGVPARHLARFYPHVRRRIDSSKVPLESSEREQADTVNL